MKKMTLEEFLDPNLDEVGLQRSAKRYALKNPELAELYKKDPVGFAYRFKRVVDDIAHRYLHLIAEFNPTLSQKITQGIASSRVSQKVSNRLENKLMSKGLKLPKGFGLYSIISGIPSIFSHYGAIKKDTGDSYAASYVALQDMIKSAVPFSDSLVDDLGAIPMQKHIEYKMRDELRKEFGLSSINSRTKASNSNYGPSKVKIRTIGRK